MTTAAQAEFNTALARGVELFNTGQYWHSHEAWEMAWNTDRHGPDAAFLKGLIQVAAGCLHASRHNRRGAVNKWRSGCGLVRPYLPAHHGVEAAALVAAVTAMLEVLEGAPSGTWPALGAMPIIAFADGSGRETLPRERRPVDQLTE